MKKKLLLVLLTISIPFAMVACSKKDEVETLPGDQMVETPAQTKAEELPEIHTDEAIAQMTDEEIINECLALLGKTDVEATKVLDGGEENYSADGDFLIGRNYNKILLFGGETVIGTSYSEAGITNSISVELKGNDTEFYKVELTELFGEATESVDTPSEAGAIYEMWEKDGKQIFLYVMEDMCTLQFILPEK